tara:strand:- start:794 stop:1420 length:627 start_codon:yes stop_codon:yes gene_type:complete
MKLEDFTLSERENFRIENLKRKEYRKIIREQVAKVITLENSLLEAQNVLVTRGQAVHDAIMKADERLSMQRSEKSEFFKNFFKTYSGMELPTSIHQDTDTEILVQLNKYAVDMKEKGYKEFDIPMFESLKQWFKDDWVRIDTQGNIAGKCGTMKKGKKTTRCLPRKKAQSLTKAQRKSTSAKKAKSKKQYVSNTKAAGGRKKRGRKKK